MRIQRLILLAAVFFAGEGIAAGFDCQNAKTKVERMICSDPEISALDESLTSVYQSSSRERQDQLNWLAQRNTCQQVSCLKNGYLARIAELKFKTNATLMTCEGANALTTEYCDSVSRRGGAGLYVARPLKCLDSVRQTLSATINRFKTLPQEDGGDVGNPANFSDLRTGYKRLLPDIAVTLAHAGCLKEAMDAVALAKTDLVREEARAHVAIALAQRGWFDVAFSLMDRLTNQEIVQEVKYQIGLELVRTGQHSVALNLLMEVDFDQAWKQLETPAYVYVKALVEAGWIEKANNFVKAGERGADLNVMILVANELARRNRLREANALMDKALEFARQEDEDRGTSSFVDHVTHSKVTVLVYGRDFRSARQLVPGIGELRRQIQSLVEIAEAVPDPEFSRDTLQRAERLMGRCRQEDAGNCGIYWSWIAEGYATTGQIAHAVNLAKVAGPAHSDFLLTNVAVVAIKKGDLQSGREILAGLSGKPWQSSEVIKALAIAEGRVGHHGDARRLAVQLDNAFLRAMVMVALAAESPEGGEVKEWLAIASKIKTPDMQAMGTQALCAAWVRRSGEAALREWLTAEESSLNPLAIARCQLGAMQGLMGMVPGKIWLASLGI